MRKIIVSEFISLDGIMEDPGGAEQTENGGWSIPFWNEEAATYKLDELFAVGTLLLGRKTYEAFAAVWPEQEDEQGFADRMNSIPKVVLSATLKETAWNNTSLITKDFRNELLRLKEESGQDILVEGSAELVNYLVAEKLADEFRIMIHPVLLGKGKPLFGKELKRITLTLTSSRILSSGIVILAYEPVYSSDQAGTAIRS